MGPTFAFFITQSVKNHNLWLQRKDVNLIFVIEAVVEQRVGLVIWGLKSGLKSGMGFIVSIQNLDLLSSKKFISYTCVESYFSDDHFPFVGAKIAKSCDPLLFRSYRPVSALKFISKYLRRLCIIGWLSFFIIILYYIIFSLDMVIFLNTNFSN